MEFWLVAGRCQGRCGSSRGSKFELRSVPISSLPGSRGRAWLWWVLFATRDPTYGLKSATCFPKIYSTPSIFSFLQQQFWDTYLSNDDLSGDLVISLGQLFRVRFLLTSCDKKTSSVEQYPPQIYESHD